ncbi:hypothetical protein EDE08_109366 [Bradyrhizobium sp. R2.2-H]|jgi:hypothetical protein|uniref:hypothetical protein n=1 Tax=unclassified Bradyrhizobium TaxID=2631580 RepID=UPI0010449564|nr:MULTISPECIES: hypothetical protein [unclassified Bradyrhizobium]TCU68237.1 hypothetical protein EDE10_10947 [Bradyrhizobium sp. Y-H1]TCU70141.1 hypothetical protein EDE08_109366 [Bradyrhizobium sp. R2.2-H]
MSDPIKELEKARLEMVSTRRRLVSILAGSYERGKTEDATEKLIQIQKAIEAIDAAIADEKQTAPKKSSSQELRL